MAKASKAEIERRVSDVYPLVLAGFRLREIRRYVSEKCSWGPVNDRTLERYIARARAEVRKAADYERVEKLATAIARLDSLYAAAYGRSELKTCLAVQREINSLLDLGEERLSELEAAVAALLDAQERKR